MIVIRCGLPYLSILLSSCNIIIAIRYGLSGFAGLLLREDFMESIETLKKIVGMDDMFRMSLHELTACIYYKLAIDRGLRGCKPDGEFNAHKARSRELVPEGGRGGDVPDDAGEDCKDADDEDISRALK